jgi:hypothetical protein
VGRSGQGGGFTAARVNVNVNVKMLLHPAPQKFTTFAKFAKFADFDPAREHPTPIHRHAPRLGSISERAVQTQNPLSRLDGPGTHEVGGG